MKYSAESKAEIAFAEHGERDCACGLDTRRGDKSHNETLVSPLTHKS